MNLVTPTPVTPAREKRSRVSPLPLFLAALAAVCTTAASFAAPPAVPEILAITDTSTSSAQPQISWTPVANPSGGNPHYKVFRDGSPTPLVTITTGTTTYTDTAPPDPNATDGLIDARHSTYAYTVSAVNPVTAEESAQSAPSFYGFRRTPLVLKWDDDRYSPATDFRTSSWPGGATQPPRVTIGSDGIGLTANGQPVRFIGVNFAYGGNLPAKTDAPQIAARLAQFGVNLVRLHNIDDKSSEPFAVGDVQHNGHEGILLNPAATFAGASSVNATELDKLDFFIGELRKNHIYVDLNLRVQKDYPTPAGGASARYKGIDLYYEDYIDEQEAYATFLLNHVNPYSGNVAYKADPTIAIVEINNEDGLISNWWGGTFDGTLDPAHSSALTTQWNTWLAAKYPGGQTALNTAWAPVTTAFPTATELLTNVGFASQALSPWQAYGNNGVGAATSIVSVGGTEIPGGGYAARITISNPTPSTPGNAYMINTASGAGIAADTTRPHTLRFHARIGEAGVSRTIRVGWRKHSNFVGLHNTNLDLSDAWREFAVVLPARATNDGPVDVYFSDLARQAGDIYITNISLKVGHDLAGATAVAVESTAGGSDLVGNGNFPTTTAITDNTGWTLTDSDARIQPVLGATSVVAGGGDGGGTGNNAATIAVSSPNESGGIYLRRSGLSFTAGRTYALTFHAKHSVNATTANKMSVNGRQSASGSVYLTGSFLPTTAWQTFTHVFTASSTTTTGCIDFQLGNMPSGTFSLSQVTVQEYAVTGLGSETFGSVTFPKRIDFHKRSRAMQTDWLGFLWDTETTYWKRLRDHIVSITGTSDRPLIIGTQVDFSPCYIQAQDTDIVDSHSYWQHYATLPNGILTASNIAMAGHTGGADTVGLRSSRRIINKPYMGTESGHGYPNTYGGEGTPIAAAYAAMQNWQGLCLFAYEDHNREEYLTSVSTGLPYNGTGISSGGNFASGFEGVWTMGRAPAKMTTLPFAIKALGQVTAAPAERSALVVTDKATAIEMIRLKQKANIGATDFASGAISSMLAFTTKLGTRLDASSCYSMRPAMPVTSGALSDPSGALTWDTTSNTRRALITTPQAKAFYGYYDPGVSAPAISLGDDVTVKLGDTMQHRTNVGTVSTECWGGISLVLKEGNAFGALGSRWLVTTAGYTDNFKATWQTYRGPLSNEDPVHVLPSSPAAVGGTPTFVERIGATLTFTVAGGGLLAAYSLDENGDRIAPLAVSYSGATATVTIPADTPTLWYEMGVSVPSTAFTLSFPAGSGGYGATGSTAIGKFDAALAANTSTRTTDEAAWEKIGTAADTLSLMVSSDTSSPGNASGTQSLILSPGGSGFEQGGFVDLRGQNIPSNRIWELEARMKFTSGTNTTVDDLHLEIGQEPDFPVVHVALSRPVGGTNFSVQLDTGGGMASTATVASGNWAKIRVRVTPPGASGAPAGGLLQLWVNDVAQTLADTTLPSLTALPDELHVYAGANATGNAWVDEIKVTIP